MVIKKVLTRLTTFFKFRSKSSRSQGQKYWYPQKSLVTINTHVKYQSSNSHGSNIISKIKVAFFLKIEIKGSKILITTERS